MKHVTYAIERVEELDGLLSNADAVSSHASASSVLVQIFTHLADEAWCTSLAACVLNHMPTAVVVGASTVGEVYDGQTVTEHTVVGISYFASSQLTAISFPCEAGAEHVAGRSFHHAVKDTCVDVVGVLLLATPLSMDAANFLQGLGQHDIHYPVFGGGAGDYAQMNRSLVFVGTDIIPNGFVGVVFSGDELFIETHTYLGWRPLSKEMTITDVDAMVVNTVDNGPAFELYNRYLGVPNDENFFLNILEFPFLMNRDGRDIARVPVSVVGDGGLQFVADIKEGERFRIGYGDPSLIISDAKGIQQKAEAFGPDAVFLYTCGCRRFLMQDETNLETLPFQSIAPTFGFYTYGEFFNHQGDLQLLNSTMVAVSLREGGGGASRRPSSIMPQSSADLMDPYARQHSRIITRLVHFVNAVTHELELANQSIMKLSVTDQLTGLNNRRKLDEELNEIVGFAVRYQQPFSVILMDIDHFKQVNDTHGHLVGDDVLKHMADILRVSVRDTDVLGRWGGEEFLLILPNTDLEQALRTAEKLRQTVEQAQFPVVGHKTGSLGVAAYGVGDTLTTLLDRADQALYEAKHGGRNRVCCKDG